MLPSQHLWRCSTARALLVHVPAAAAAAVARRGNMCVTCMQAVMDAGYVSRCNCDEPVKVPRPLPVAALQAASVSSAETLCTTRDLCREAVDATSCV